MYDQWILNVSVKVIQWEKNSLDRYLGKKNLKSHFTKYAKINSKWKRSKITTLLKKENRRDLLPPGGRQISLTKQ